MRRMLTIAAMLALALPSLAAAEEPHPRGKPGGAKPGVAKPAVMPHGPPGGPHGPPPGPRGGPVAGPHGGPLTFRGHEIHRAHLAPFVYPPGYGYRHWAAGMALPPLFLAPAYFYADWAALGLVAPEAGFQWVRYGPDLLLVNVTTGQVVDAVYGVFY
ncbi:MAG: RcnB family protein [Xanthobacteraceae bacterium]